ncbi:MAG: hypothetical protein KGI73_02360 [Patescibacteria group bacterium]|nr:hypothetical protein [Patescibacteria group bacterium]
MFETTDTEFALPREPSVRAAWEAPEAHSGRPIVVTQGERSVHGTLCFMYWDGSYKEVTVDLPDGKTEHFDAKDGPITVTPRPTAHLAWRSFQEAGDVFPRTENQQAGGAGAFLLGLVRPKDERDTAGVIF